MKLEEYRDENGYIKLDEFLDKNSDSIEYKEEVRGTEKRNKVWVKYEDETLLLRDENLANYGVLYTVEQELVTEELAKQVGVECAHYDMGIRDGKKCSISYNILDKEEYKQNQLILLDLSLFVEQLEFHQPNDHTYYIKDAMNAIKNFGKKSNVDVKDIESVLKKYLKSVIFDCATGATDRHCQNVGFVYGTDKNTKKPIFDFSPLYDNELSCGSEEPIENVRNYMEDYLAASEAAKNASPCASLVINNDAYDNKKVDVNAKLLNYIVNLDPELYTFFENCINNMDVMKAITEVEKRINAKLPKEYKNQLLGYMLPRKKYMVAIKDAIDRNKEEKERKRSEVKKEGSEYEVNALLERFKNLRSGKNEENEIR